MNLTDGAHTISITDDNGCGPVDLNQDIIIPEEITFDAATVEVENICTGSFNGSITLDVGGLTINGGQIITAGIENYLYTWTLPSGATSITKNLTGLTESGQYSLMVEDNVGCTAGPFTVDLILTTLDIVANSPLTQDLSCYGDQDGEINIQVNSSDPGAFNINWFKNGVDIGNSGAQTISGLGAGSYRVDVTSLNDPDCGETA